MTPHAAELIRKRTTLPRQKNGTIEERRQRREQAVRLLNTYGGLLTGKQRAFSQANLVDGRSFAAIARDAGVSRQAVHDAVQHALAAMNEYDRVLGLSVPAGTAVPAHVPPSEAVQKLENLRRRVTQQGVIYSTDWIVRELNETLAMLRPVQPENAAR